MRSISAGLGASLLAHAAAFGVLVVTARAPADSSTSDPVLLVDIELAPEPPKAVEPLDVADEPETVEPAATVDTAPIDPVPEDPPEEIVEVVPDAGVPDGGMAAAAGELDAGTYADATMIATGPSDAGPSSDSSSAVAVASGDAGVVVSDAGTAVASAGDAGPARVSTWSDVDFSTYVPSGDKLSVLMRLDRLRDTEWAPFADKILRPMPDYETIIGSRKMRIVDQFEMLLMSSSNPADVAATTVVGRSKRSGKEVRKFLDHKQSPVTWSSATGGAVGRRTRPRNRADDRIYLLPFPDWVVLTKPQNLGTLITPSKTKIDKAVASESDLPAWLAKVRSVEALAGSEDNSPAIVLSAQDLPESFVLPRVGKLPGPKRLSLALEVSAEGFLVRGVLEFESDDLATTFERDVKAARSRLLKSFVTRALLLNMHVFNAVKGLSLKRRSSKIAYATSISISDARAMMEVAAAWTQGFYDQKAIKRKERRSPPTID